MPSQWKHQPTFQQDGSARTANANEKGSCCEVEFACMLPTCTVNDAFLFHWSWMRWVIQMFHCQAPSGPEASPMQAMKQTKRNRYDSLVYSAKWCRFIVFYPWLAQDTSFVLCQSTVVDCLGVSNMFLASRFSAYLFVTSRFLSQIAATHIRTYSISP